MVIVLSVARDLRIQCDGVFITALLKSKAAAAIY